MKNKYFFKTLAIASLFSIGAMAQSENVGIGTVKPNESALLDLSSSSKGLLIPRMSAEQRTAISTPAQGLMVYQTGKETGFYFYDGTTWKAMGENLGEKSLMALIDPWKLGGNDITADPTAFIGTTSGHPLKFKSGNDVAGLLETNSNANTFYGFRSGASVTSGISNTAIGGRAMENLTAASYNTAIGGYALRNLTAGGDNMSIGLASLINLTNANGNTAIGNFALSTLVAGTGGTPRKNFNTAIGLNALQFMVNGESNTAISSNALKNFQNGSGNTAIGNGTLGNLLIGDAVTAIGSEAGLNATGSYNTFLGFQAGKDETTSNKLYISNSGSTTPLIYGDFSAKYVTIGDVTPALRTQGVATGGYNLLVKGGILTEKVKVALAAAGTDWADYVFEPSYKSKMMKLEDVEQFTIANKHLPNVPSAEEMVKNGLDVSQTSKMFMEKIEELTLYMIEMNKEIKALKAENAKLKK